MIQFIDAEYNAGDFYRIMEGLRRVILERSISEEVLCYEGDIKILLQRELSAVSRLNEMTNGDEFLFHGILLLKLPPYPYPSYCLSFSKIWSIAAVTFL